MTAPAAAPPKTLDHLSYSQLQLFDKCPASWKAIKIDGLAQQTTSYMAMGSLVHLLIAKELATGETDMTPMFKALHTPESDQKEALGLLERWRKMRPTAPGKPEVTLLFPLETDPPINFVGIVDFWHPGKSGPVIWDWKTGYKIPKLTDGIDEVWQQLIIYAGAIDHQYGLGAGKWYELNLAYVRRGKRLNCQVHVNQVRRTRDLVQQKCQDVLTALATGDLPTTPGRGCETCPLQDTCEARKAAA